jgi:hypothetical protein
MSVNSLLPGNGDDPQAWRPVALVDLLDRVLATGVVITGDITLSIAEVDLVRVSLRALIASVSALGGEPAHPRISGGVSHDQLGRA